MAYKREMMRREKGKKKGGKRGKNGNGKVTKCGFHLCENAGGSRLLCYEKNASLVPLDFLWDGPLPAKGGFSHDSLAGCEGDD
jgi:hypothetical protein